MAKESPKTVTAFGFNGETYEVDISQLKWRPSAYGIVIKNDKLLLLKQTNGYDLPGGGVELGEMPEAAVLREITEETGVKAKNPKLITIHSTFYKPHLVTRETYVQSLMIYYACEYAGGELSTDGFDEYEQQYAEAPEWYPINKLDDLKIGTSNDFRDYVRQVLER